MQFSASIEFEEIPNLPSADSISDFVAPPPEVPEIKFRVPSTPLLETDNIIRFLMPHQALIDQIQALLLWRRPVQFGIFVFLFESILFFIQFTGMGFFPFICFYILILYTLKAISFKYHDFFASVVFPPVEDRGSENETNRIFTLEEIASFISVVGSRIHTFLLGCKQKADDPTIFGQIIWITFLFCFFMLAVIVRTFPLFFLFLHVIVFLPGIIFHPIVNPHILPYLQRLMMTIAPKIKDE
ncbi:hypothetical protein TRFO_35773 [Tritrichomonas foetus]|uniref:Uncharacterized protein n=1 Tax=Tritrichomonas foetus TaxID=1144522 RepID=A0A1J4JFB2_9EUKA|nr:hypothetical protein TRFO_35773 [Tritrichomonas foetus]|eukprot:OHS97902.1 hypothetical protein TRFO_35773 [Tritrichomonas foetus]